VWTLQYACPRCAGQAAPLCLGRCDEVLIGCMSSLQQVIVQLNVLLEFARGKFYVRLFIMVSMIFYTKCSVQYSF